MPDFVKENSLNEIELANQLSKSKETTEQYILEEKPERKSLQEQLRESREQKQLEYQKLLESQNSSYKLDEESAKFYDELKQKEKEKELKSLKEEQIELQKFRRIKSNQQPVPHTNKSILSSIKVLPNKVTKKRQTASGVVIRRKELKGHIEDDKRTNVDFPIVKTSVNESTTSKLSESCSISKHTTDKQNLVGYDTSSDEE